MQFVALLIVVALVVKFWWLIAAVVGMFCAAHWTRRAVDRHAERVEVERRRLAELVARADQQHNWVMQGNPRGTFGGEFPAAPM
jgi:nitrate/nitrite transporter NarK